MGYGTWERRPDGLLRQFLYDHAEEKLVTHVVQDVEPILETNKRLANDWKPTRGEEFRHEAHIPLVVVEQWLKKGINVLDPNDEKKVVKLLNDPEWSYLRTRPGRF